MTRPFCYVFRNYTIAGSSIATLLNTRRPGFEQEETRVCGYGPQHCADLSDREELSATANLFMELRRTRVYKGAHPGRQQGKSSREVVEPSVAVGGNPWEET
jgi:hypothetical protein